jgi:diacylglycerol kinase (ATP)
VLPAVRSSLRAVGIEDVRLTKEPGDEERLAREAAASGIGTIIALGGDGTWGNVARGILGSGRDVRLVLMAAGTGNDFAHTIDVPASNYEAMARIAAAAASRRVDLGRVDDVAYLNVAGLGITTEVLSATDPASRLPGPMLYFAAAIPLLGRYQAFPARISQDARPAQPTAQYLAIIVSNGARFGGGFRIAPGASAGDGLLDLVTVRDASLVRRVALFGRARIGAHLDQPEVDHSQVWHCVVSLEAAPVLDIDGELRSARSSVVEFSCLPGALRIGVAA